MLPIIRNILWEKKPYFIVVSDEGPASSPKQHPDFASAYNESLRLAKLHPNIKFGVFEYKGHADSARLKTKVTKWFAVYNNNGSGNFRVCKEDLWDQSDSPKSKLFDTKQEALESIEGFPAPIGAFPIETEVPAETPVRFNTYTDPYPIRRIWQNGELWPIYTGPQN